MGCPFYKKAGGAKVGTCEAAKKLMIPSVDEERRYCEAKLYDECEVYREYISRCRNEDFAKILSEP